MKNLSLILNVVLLALVANLYYQGCSGKKAVVTDSLSKMKGDSTATAGVASSALKVVYVNQDTLLEKYTYFKGQKTALEQRFKSAESSLREKGQQLQRSMMALQEKAQKGTTPPAQLQQEEQGLQQAQQNLVAEQQSKEKELSDELRQINDGLQKKITGILEVLKKTDGFDYVVNYTTGGPFLLTNARYDITQEVLAELNKK